MNIQQLISSHVPIVCLQDNAEKALTLMTDYHLVQLPLVQHNKYLGIVKEDELLDLLDTDIAFEKFQSGFFKPALLAQMHVYDGAKIMKENHLQILPLVDAANNYLGSVTQENMFNYLVDGTQSMEHGGILVLEVQQANFSISHISRVFESENVSILSLQLHNIENSNLIELTVKTNRQDLRAIVATLERLNFKVQENYSELQSNEDLETNFAGLMNYLNI